METVRIGPPEGPDSGTGGFESRNTANDSQTGPGIQHGCAVGHGALAQLEESVGPELYCFPYGSIQQESVQMDG